MCYLVKRTGKLIFYLKHANTLIENIRNIAKSRCSPAQRVIEKGIGKASWSTPLLDKGKMKIWKKC